MIAPSAVRCQPSQFREGVEIQFTGTGVELSPQWRMGGWLLQFAQMQKGASLALDHRSGPVYVKVITGRLTPSGRAAFADSREIRTTRIADEKITASGADALVSIFTETEDVPASVTDMRQLVIEGPHADAFQWLSFARRFGRFMDDFNEADAYMSGGFHLLDAAGVEICYVNLWTAGKGVNLSTHNHAQPPGEHAPAFAEIHWVFNNGTGGGGMYDAASRTGPVTRRYIMQRGEEHGPFFMVDLITEPASQSTVGRPRLRSNGAVDYPWHGWQAGEDQQPGQAYDVVAAFEINPEFVHLKSLPAGGY